MSDTTIEVLKLGAVYLGLLITIIGIGINSVVRVAKVNFKIAEMEKELDAMDKRHSLDIKRIEISIELLRKENNEESERNSKQHIILFDELKGIGKGVASIQGWIKGKSEKNNESN